MNGPKRNFTRQYVFETKHNSLGESSLENTKHCRVMWITPNNSNNAQKEKKKKKKKERPGTQWAKCTGKSFLKQHIYFNVHFLFLLSKFLRRHNTICITGRYLCRFTLIFLCHFILLLANKTKQKCKRTTWIVSETCILAALSTCLSLICLRINICAIKIHSSSFPIPIHSRDMRCALAATLNDGGRLCVGSKPLAWCILYFTLYCLI